MTQPEHLTNLCYLAGSICLLVTAFARADPALAVAAILFTAGGLFSVTRSAF